MGMYTELHFNAELRKETPKEVIEALQYMLGRENPEPEPKIAHPLFKTDRWSYMLTMDSYYFAADTNSTLRFDEIAGQYFLCVRCNLKNYGGEIELFIDWIDPWVDAHEGDFLGYHRYEESEDPALIRKGSQSAKESQHG